MEIYKNIKDTKYVISRVFAENTTAEMLIEERVKKFKNSSPPLTSNIIMMYNIDSGSIQSKEVQ